MIKPTLIQSQMKKIIYSNLLLVLMILTAACTGGGGGGSGSASGSTTGGIQVTSGGGSSGGSSGSTGGTTGGIGGSTGSATTGGTGGGGTSTGASSTGGTGGDTITTAKSLNVDAISGRVVVPYSFDLFNTASVLELKLTLNLINVNSFQNVTIYDNAFLATTSLTEPIGNIVVPGPGDLFTTFALTPANEVNTLNYQTRSADNAITSGAYLQDMLFDRKENANVHGVVIAKNDANLNAGNVNLNVFLVGSEAQSDSIKAIINEAVGTFKTIYSSINVGITEKYYNVTSSTGVLPNPTIGSSFYEANTNSATLYSLNLFIGDTISSDGTQLAGNELTGVVGVSSSIPGPGIPTKYTAVAVSLNQHAGPDGIFSVTEKSIFAETMAHECGHYLGLFHPVESGNFDEFDPLDDTLTCSSVDECKSNGVANNLMYPDAIVGISQRDLTSDQGGVINRNAIVD